MFKTTGFVTILILLKLAVGAVLGLVISWLILRSNFTWKPAVLAAVASSLLFIVGSGLVGWASSHEAWMNGKRMDIAPWGENLRWRNRIAENELLICLLPSSLAALAVSLNFRKSSHK
jgi:hypothetical protein